MAQGGEMTVLSTGPSAEDSDSDALISRLMCRVAELEAELHSCAVRPSAGWSASSIGAQAVDIVSKLGDLLTTSLSASDADGRVDAATSRSEDLVAERDAAVQAKVAAVQAFRETEERLQEAGQALGLLAAEVTQLKGVAEQRDADVKELQRIISSLEDAAQQQTERFESELEDKAGEVECVQQQLSERSEQLTAVRERLRAAEEALARATVERDAGRALVARGEEALAAALAEQQAKAAQLERAAADLAASQSDTARAQAAVEEYKAKYLEERKARRTLHEHLQVLRGNIRVLCRVRPCRDGHANAVDLHPDQPGAVTVHQPDKSRSHSFEFNDVCGPVSSQEDVFNCISPLVHSCADEYNVCIFAYGQTGSGKTHTMTGTPDAPGISDRSLALLFALMDEQESSHKVEVALMEIYCEQVRDLAGADPLKALEVCGLGAGQLGARQARVPDLSWHAVSSMADVQAVLARGNANRTTHATAMNAASSRSHALVSVRVTPNQENSARYHTLTLIDLAGSERMAKSEVEGQQLSETKSINKSLSALGDVIAALQSSSPHVPYRNSKLTQVLQDSLCGSSKVLLVCNVSPEEGSVSETLCSLGFAQRAAQVELGLGQKGAKQAKELKTPPPLRLSSGRRAPGVSRKPLADSSNAAN